MRQRGSIAAHRAQQGDRRLAEALPTLAQVVCSQEVRVARRRVFGNNRAVAPAMHVEVIE
jgi:hypothetical protein